MDAKDNQVIATGKEHNSSDYKPQQRKARNLDVAQDDEPMIALAEGLADDDETYAAELAFLEEPLKIMIMVPTMPGDKHPPRTVQCWVNGKGAEQLTNGKWMQCGWLPLGVPVVTRRKYVEVLLRSKTDMIHTEVIHQGEGVSASEQNIARRLTSGKYTLSVLADQSPRAHEWLSTLAQEQ